MKESLFEEKISDNESFELINLIETLRSEVVGNKPQTIIDRLGGET